jgi:hypothetical protein
MKPSVPAKKIPPDRTFAAETRQLSDESALDLLELVSAVRKNPETRSGW